MEIGMTIEMEMEMTKQMEIEMGMTIEMEMGKEMGRKRGRVSLRGFWHGLGSVKDLPTLTDERMGDFFPCFTGHKHEATSHVPFNNHTAQQGKDTADR